MTTPGILIVFSNQPYIGQIIFSNVFFIQDFQRPLVMNGMTGWKLNSKTVIGTTFENGVKEIELVPLSCGLLSFSHPYDGCALYLFSTFYDASAGHIYSIKENSRINSVTLNGNKLIMNTSINFTFCCYVYTYR